ncbi:MAG: hypothetical protein JJU34_08790 [Lunatimonas sp.]|uniref:hypothetical protein n=1 Tax=Lunatimonas sp. TaxID=2060141 RepID=UPI00263A712B|nr:hypothetical protein [Lunatimonas sp.]MCC5937364.1 hypothetical protein [Lunatimonas sp.]
MKYWSALLTLTLIACTAYETQAQQAEGSILLSGALDLAKTDAPGVIRRYQIGMEGNYFYRHNLSFSGGYEFNHSYSNQVTLGSRFYPLEKLFIRARGLVGSRSDFAAGAGYTHNISYRVRLEGMADYYVATNVFGLRAGIGILIN